MKSSQLLSHCWGHWILVMTLIAYGHGEIQECAVVSLAANGGPTSNFGRIVGILGTIEARDVMGITTNTVAN
jgi:hypothetical protein